VKTFTWLGDVITKHLMTGGKAKERPHYVEYEDEEEYYDEEYEYEVDEEEEARAKQQRKAAAKNSVQNMRNFAHNMGTGTGTAQVTKDNVYGFPKSAATNAPVGPIAEFVVSHPVDMDDVVTIGHNVIAGRMCIVDMTNVGEEAQRVADYLCGMCDGIGGSISRVSVSGTVIAVAPANFSGINYTDVNFAKKATSDK